MSAGTILNPLCASGAIAQAPCLADADGDHHPLFGMSVVRADPEFEPNGETAAQSAVHLAFGDLDGDGDLDIVVPSRDREDPESWVAVLLNRGDGVFDRAPLCDAGIGENAVALGDMNSDGVPDIVVAAALSDEVGVLLGRGTARSRMRCCSLRGTTPAPSPWPTSTATASWTWPR
jgi:hypothetical protein